MNHIQLTIVLGLAFAAAASGDLLHVELANGELRGRDAGLYYSYESIPYAKPPIGDLALEDPVPYDERWEHTFDATKVPVECLQWNQLIPLPYKLTGSEDCLTVSVYRPKNPSRKDYPVVVHIFGGGWSFGSPDSSSVDLLMKRGNLIVVKINYRVGPLGFLSTGDEVIPGNFGLKDQRLAIKWIHRNIGRFGGDNRKIILVGGGTGGSSVHLQLMHKDMEKTLKGAISIGGTALTPHTVQASGRELAFQFGESLGCVEAKTSQDLKDCLKKAPGEDLVKAAQQLQEIPFMPFGLFTPVIESSTPETRKPFLTEMPIDIIKKGKSAQIPWLASYTTENGLYNAAPLLQRNSNGTELITELNTRWIELAPQLLAYPSAWSKAQSTKRSLELKIQYLGLKQFGVANYFDVQRMFTNELYKNGLERALDVHKTYGSSPVYSYLYDNPASKSFTQLLTKRGDLFLGTGLGDDLNLIFGNPIYGEQRSDERVISTKFVRMIEGFAKDGTLIYDKCTFPDMRGKNHFYIVAIKRTFCDILDRQHLPDTIVPNLPPSPIVAY